MLSRVLCCISPNLSVSLPPNEARSSGRVVFVNFPLNKITPFLLPLSSRSVGLFRSRGRWKGVALWNHKATKKEKKTSLLEWCGKGKRQAKKIVVCALLRSAPLLKTFRARNARCTRNSAKINDKIRSQQGRRATEPPPKRNVGREELLLVGDGYGGSRESQPADRGWWAWGSRRREIDNSRKWRLLWFVLSRAASSLLLRLCYVAPFVAEAKAKAQMYY